MLIKGQFMDVVLCHRTADFDTLGAAVGVAKLQPGTRIVLCGGAHPAVRDFLALYRDEYPLIERRSVPVEKLRSLTVVDTQRRELLGKAAEWLEQPELEITLYDHHLHIDCDIPTHHVELDAVGATTTLIVEKLQAQQLLLSTAEATVMALGIHVDTGSLTYGHATVRDAEALAWLMAQGANQRAIATYTEPGFSPELQELLGQALEGLQSQSIHRHLVSWVLLTTTGYVPGLSSLASQLMLLSESDCLMLGNFYKTRSSSKDRLTIIGRSRIEGLDLHDLLRPLGGGGHPRAVAATLKTSDPQLVITQLVGEITRRIPQPPSAADLMSAPVRTIRPHTTINQARRVLLRYGHSGLSVVNEQDQLVGIISRRDLDVALHHGFGHAPVKGYMTAPVRTISPHTPLPEIEALMVTYDIGRLPVVEADHLVGIVTRTDILRQLHQLQQPPLRSAHEVVRTSIQHRLQTLLSPQLQAILQAAAAAATERGWQLYLVGGGVRDLLLASEGHPLQLPEFDLVVDGVDGQGPAGSPRTGAAVELAQALRHVYPQTQIQIYGQFQTAALLWKADIDGGGFSVDIATARSEFYPYPAANPEVATSSIRQDLYRRDFTINALAVRLTKQRFQQRQGGELLDFFGGLVDLQQRQVRVLHPNSFIEDPTRIFRAVRFATRLQFQIESQTELYIRHAIASGIYQQAQSQNHKAPALQARLRNELKYIFRTPHWSTALRLLSELGALQCLHPQLQIDQRWWRQVHLALRWSERFDPKAQLTHQWLVIVEVLVAYLPLSDRTQVAQTLHLPEMSQGRLQGLEATERAIGSLNPHTQRPSQIVQTLQPYNLPMLILIAARGSLWVRRCLWLYLDRWAEVKPLLKGQDLIQLGYPPGRQFKTMLAALAAATLDGEIKTKAEAKAWVGDRFPQP